MSQNKDELQGISLRNLKEFLHTFSASVLGSLAGLGAGCLAKSNCFCRISTNLSSKN